MGKQFTLETRVWFQLVRLECGLRQEQHAIGVRIFNIADKSRRELACIDEKFQSVFLSLGIRC